MKFLFKNAKILKDAYADIFDGEVLVEDGKITYVGKAENLRADAVKDCLLLPTRTRIPP